ncbi:hypothetical protein [uncultured Paracoccus sp.]|uniref:hypothetical protein n=1 Tax=uncultured Paracoccus sp. TaxID=189685 RepID=UPI0025D5D8FB|nr:hypothetical protein [uncultured Paracoccus sp.]
MTRVFLHAGFHKTGTKSLQHFLRQNGAIIRPSADFVLPEDLRDITRLGFWYQDLPDPQLLAQMQTALQRVFARCELTQPGQNRRKLIISAENLLGRLPDGETDRLYPAATDLLRTAVQSLSVLPPPVDIVVYLSLRRQDDWVRSLHGHLAMKQRRIRLTDDLAQFSARLDREPLRDVAARIVVAFSPRQTVMRDITELASAPFGIAQPIVDFLDLPPDQRARLQPLQHLHRSADPRLVGDLIALNRSPFDADALAAAKNARIAGNVLAGTDMKGNLR